MEEIELEQEIEKRERLGSCEICDESQAKYTCPKCEIHTCSLTCSKNHKQQYECDGVRDKAKYIPLKKMTPVDFMNDYYFLEEATRFTKNIKTNELVAISKRNHPKLAKLKKAAFKRNIKLFYIDKGLVKHSKNYSRYDKVKDEINWVVQVKFPNANFEVEKKFGENIKIQDIVKSILDGNQNEKQLEFYRSHGIDKLRVLLKAEGLRKNSNRFYDLDLTKTLKFCLNNKVIIEYPSLYIVFDYLMDNFEIVDSDDESHQNEQKIFLQTLKEEIFNKKIGQNPMLIVRPEEIPVIAKIIEDEQAKLNAQQQKNHNHQQHQHQQQNELKDTPQTKYDNDDDCSDNEIAPENYFFTK